MDDLINDLTNWTYLRSTGMTPVTLPSTWTEALISVYFLSESLHDQIIYKNSLLREMLLDGINTRFFMGGYYVSTSDYGYCFVNAQYNSICIRNMTYGGKDYSNTSKLLVRYI